MTIEYAILGFLDCEPMTGYDIKKLIEQLPFMHWSGNNNQIYKALSTLHQNGLVVNETINPETGPSKKIYSITSEGQDTLTQWACSTPELPEIKSEFLIQLAWSHKLTDKKLAELIDAYKVELRTRISMLQEEARRGQFSPNRTAREECIWEAIYENVRQGYVRELEWLEALVKKLDVQRRRSTKNKNRRS